MTPHPIHATATDPVIRTFMTACFGCSRFRTFLDCSIAQLKDFLVEKLRDFLIDKVLFHAAATAFPVAAAASAQFSIL
jgi:hypothetical protein